jgi:hypothetical protein
VKKSLERQTSFEIAEPDRIAFRARGAAACNGNTSLRPTFVNDRSPFASPYARRRTERVAHPLHKTSVGGATPGTSAGPVLRRDTTLSDEGWQASPHYRSQEIVNLETRLAANLLLTLHPVIRTASG